MSLPAMIEDGGGKRYRLRVMPDGSILTSSSTSSSKGKTATELTFKKQFRGFLVNSAGGDSLAVDGSTTPVEFSLTQQVGKVLFITNIRIVLHSTYMELQTNDFRRFGTAAVAPGLTNGILLYVEQSGVQTNLFIDPIQTIGDFMDYADDFTNFVNAISSQSDFLSFDFNFDTPVVLVPGSTDKIEMVVRDNLTSIDLFRVIGRGYQEIV